MTSRWRGWIDRPHFDVSPRASLIRQAVSEYQAKGRRASDVSLQEALEQTAGIWQFWRRSRVPGTNSQGMALRHGEISTGLGYRVRLPAHERALLAATDQETIHDT